MTQEEKDARMGELYVEKMSLETMLSNGDYQIIKCAEAQAMGVELPYDVAALHAERQSWRERINEIDVEMKVLAAAEAEDPDDPERQEHDELIEAIKDGLTDIGIN